MSNPNPSNNLDLTDPASLLPLCSIAIPKIQDEQGDHEEEESKNQIISSKEESSPPNLNFIPGPQIKNEEPIQKNGDSHSERLNGPLEKPKTANRAFGSISDFLKFFESRNDEVEDLGEKFREMEKGDSITSLIILNEKIVPLVYESFKNKSMEFKNYESSKPAEENEENKSIQKAKAVLSKFFQNKKMQKEEPTKKEYAELFRKKFKSMEEFYKQILHAYTVNGVLYLRMNEYLRTEDWMKLDGLLIYTYCLFKAYLWGPTGLTEANSFAFLKSKSKSNNGKLTLYRRADFDQKSIDFYQKGNLEEFSWTGVTSTSLLESATRSYSGKRPEKKPVLIVIEVDFNDLSPENFNALYLAKLSKFPAEEEVALAPGSIFRLSEKVKIIEIHGKIEVKIQLKLITNAKVLAQQGKFLHGMLQCIMRNKDELKFVCLKDEELSRAIRHCKGNQCVAKLEFSLCHFKRLSVEVLLDVLPTIRKLDSITFNSVVLEEGCLDQIMKCLGDLKRKKLEMINSLGDENAVKSFIGCIKYFGSLKILKLSFEENCKIDGVLIKELYNEAVQYLDSKCVFELNMINDCNIIAKGLNITDYKPNFGRRLNEKWTIQLESSKDKIEESYFPEFQAEEKLIQIIDAEIKLNKEKFEKINEEKEDINDENDENSTKQIAKSPHQEKTLSLIGKKELFGYSLGDNSCLPKRTLLEALEDKYFFSQPSVKDQTVAEKQPLETLSLNFERCLDLHDKDPISLGCEGIEVLQSLKTLHLNYYECNGITDKALEVLSNNVLRKLTGLNNLHLSFDRCFKITDKGIKSLVYDGIQYLQSLKGLNLSFSGCSAITNEGLRSLSLEGIAKIRSSLTSIHLNFESCSKITDEGLENLLHNDGGIQNLESLTSLGLNFNHCSKITNKGVEILSSKGLKKFKKGLEVLSLSFDKCCEISDEGLRILSCEGICYLKSLTSLSLSFSDGWSSKITDQGIMNLFDQGTKRLSSLKILHLSFNECRQVKNKGLEILHFSNKLMTLHLSFNDCKEITDDGLNDLSQKISHLESLEYLHLGFINCGKITDTGLGLLCSQGIKPLSKLNVLHLRFGIISERSFHQERCVTITDLSLKSIGSEGIKHLPELKALHLDIKGCSRITAKGLKDLCDGIQYLNRLTDLHLNFFRCEGITDEGLEILSHQGIFPLKNSLRTLYLDFNECNELSEVSLKSLLNGGIHYLRQLTTLHLKFGRYGKITESQLLKLQYQINQLNLPQLQLPLEIPLEVNDLGIYSPHCQFSNCPNTAFVLCQSRLGFTHKVSTNVLDDIEYTKGDNLTLRFEEIKEGTKITDLDISNSLFCSNRMKTFKDLKILHLTFDECVMITDFTLHNLCSQGLQHLELLSCLHLSFNGCYRISDAGLEGLRSIGIKYVMMLKSLSLSFNRCCLITNQGLKSLINIKHLELLEKLHLDFGFTKITDQGFIDLGGSGILGLKSLTSLSLNFDNCDITDRGVWELYDNVLKHLESLKLMHLSFQFCKKITSRGLERLYHKAMKSLTSFFIDFPDTKITEILQTQLSQSSSSSFIFINKNSLNNKLIGKSQFQRQKSDINQGLSKIQPIPEDSVEIIENKMFTRYLGRNHYVFNAHELEYFDETCYEDPGSNIIENIEDIFKSAKKDIVALILLSVIPELEDQVNKFINEQDGQEIPYLKSLTSLTLVLGGWDKYITDSALKTICLRIFQHLNSLTNLSLIFNGCGMISNIGFRDLGSQGMKYLTSLTTLHLSFNQRVQITDVELKTLSSEVIQSLKSLTTLHLSFEECEEITDVGLQSLWTHGILHLEFLKTLDLSFEKCKWITGVGFNNADSLEENLLPSLAIFRLNLDKCVNFNDKGVESLCVGVIRRLGGLSTLHLNFDGNEKITDSGLEHLGSQGIRHLGSLENLHLSFDQCWCITDQGVQSLNLSSFKSLTSLYLNFDQCDNLANLSLKDLTSQRASLKILHLSFRGCTSVVTDQALENLGIQSLTSLDTLYLCFDGCKKITDEGIKAFFENGIQPLGRLKTLHLSFAWCENITDDGLESISHDGIKFLAELENIHLCFFACKEISHTQLSSFQARINPLQFQQCPLKIIDNIIFSGSYLHNQRFLSATIRSQEYLKRLEVSDVNDIYDENGITGFVSPAKDRFYLMSKIDTNGMVTMLQRLQKNEILRFEDNFHATDIGISSNCSYYSDDMKDFKDLEVLKIAINNSEIIKDFSLKIRSLCRDVLQRLNSLKILHISFEKSNEITDDELRILSFEGILSLVGLTQLHLSFNGCKNITDEGLKSLSSGGIQNLKQLNVLSLSFNGCDKITDKGLTSLCSDAIQNLKLLRALHLSFDGCNKITDEVLKSVSLVGILNLSSIQELQLSFVDCPKISSSSYQAFLKILEYFGYVEVNQVSKNI